MNIKPCKLPDHLTVKIKLRIFSDTSILLLSFQRINSKILIAVKLLLTFCAALIFAKSIHYRFAHPEICYDLPRPREAREARAQGGRLPKRGEAPTMMSPPSQGLLQFQHRPPRGPVLLWHLTLAFTATFTYGSSFQKSSVCSIAILTFNIKLTAGL